MSDLLAGTEVKALDFPPGQYDEEDTTQSNVSSTSYTAPTNACSVTFVAPTSGRVKLIVGGGFRDNTNDNQGFIAPEVREDNVSGAIVQQASAYARGYISMGEASDYYYHSRSTILEGLTPGQTYFARIMIKVDGGSTCDLRNKNIIVVPVP